ncbi:rRNA (guanine-N1)-methyltransferase [Shewanella submarina]|uniref:Pilus assembly protein n=1 Tax=Shewanella submarina TaxID=2016376 RepID=A0ABV7G9E9_9GAMM|nr:PilC/PilY family type IV pilus protein [Shewanella submarina]MCL1039317.1 rRNA (guanine-N1)-methyltransferase [Shewanella submarina]
MFIKKITAAAIAALTLSAGSSFADDTELYVFESSSRTGNRPQVLIIFDNSGSMSTMDTTSEKGYCPEYAETQTCPEYPALGSDNSLQERMVYFTKGGIDNTGMPVPDSPSESRRFLEAINGCEASKAYLNEFGFYTDYFMEYRTNKKRWQEVRENNGADIQTIDCLQDIERALTANAEPNIPGLPKNGTGKDPAPYQAVDILDPEALKTAQGTAKGVGFGTGQPVTLYTANYLRWHHGDKETVPESRLDIAKDAIRNTVLTTPGVDFGLAIFNVNFPKENFADGGRVVAGIQQMTDANKNDLLATINNLDPNTNTPLCETLYEAKRYFAGESVWFGDDDARPDDYNYKPNRPPRDTSIEQNGNYITPFSECNNLAYIIYITDGVPTLDSAADGKVKRLPGISTKPFESEEQDFSSHLPNLAEWMFTKDVNPNLEGEQHVKTFAIGFGKGADAEAVGPLVKETGTRGGGGYFLAKNGLDLQNALMEVFADILEVNASFTSPSIASNNFDRTHTFDAVYYAMFLPQRGPRWMGNLKKLRVTSSGDIVDKKGNPAIDSKTGNIAASACTYWTDDAICSAQNEGGDGNDVKTGGAAEILRQASARNTRALYGNFGGSGSLTAFSLQQAEIAAGSPSRLATHMGVPEAELNRYFDWAKGIDVDDDDGDGSKTDIRKDILGDPLHSKPLAINFGTASTPDVRIMMGTNHGFMHMFRDTGNQLSESWAFMPYELLPNLQELVTDPQTGVHSVYGLDSPAISYVETGPSGVEKALVFFGMRRGGKSYYGMDITSPDNPRLLWQLTPESPGMSEMGQSWSEPVVTKIPGWPTGNTNADTAKPVLIFGAGYAPGTKDLTGVGLNDAEGRGVFIVDAESGELVHSFGPSKGSQMTQMPGITDSIPNAVAVLDSNSDGLADRIYATDTGGNVWRMDMPGPTPTDSKAPWSAFKFADLGGNTNLTDRRFFAEPIVAQTMFSNITETSVSDDVSGETSTRLSYQNIPYDAVVIGSGLRPSPTNTERQDMFFTLQDRNVVTKSFAVSENPAPAPLTIVDLYSVTDAPPTSEADHIKFGTKRGWYYSYSGIGEKSLSAASVVFGRVYFSTYVPGDTSAENVCLALGQGRFYGFDLHRGTRVYKQEYLDMGEQVPDTPQLVIPPGGDDNMYFIGIGNAGDHMDPIEPAKGCDPGDPRCIGGGMRANRIYYYTQ